MRINGHGRLIKNHRCYHIRGLPPYARQAHQFCRLTRHPSPEIRYKHACHARQMPRLAVRITDALYICIQSFRGGLRHRLGRWIVAEQGRSYHIHPFVGTLGAEYNRHQQLEGISVAKLGFSRRIMGLKICKHFLVPL